MRSSRTPFSGRRASPVALASGLPHGAKEALQCLLRLSCRRVTARARLYQSQLPAEAPSFMNREPDVRQADPGNRPAHEIVQSDTGDYRVVTDEEILAPQRDPGQDKEKDADFKTENDVEDGEDAAHSSE